MKCKNCGKILFENDKFCINCGAPIETVEETAPVQEPVTETPVEQVAPVVAPAEPTVVEPVNETPVVAETPVQEPVTETPIVEPAPVATSTEPVVEETTPVVESVAPVVTPQPEVNQPMPQQPQPTNTKSKMGDKTKRNLIISIIVALALIGAYKANILEFSFEFGSSKKDEPAATSSPTTNPVITTVSYNNYTFEVPEGYAARIQQGLLQLVNNVDKKAITYNAMYDSHFAQYKADLNILKQALIANGYTVANSSLKSSNGIDCLAYELSDGTNKILDAYCKDPHSSSYIYEIATMNGVGTYDYNLLEVGTKILKNTKSTGSNSFSESNEQDITTSAGKTNMPAFTEDK